MGLLRMTGGLVSHVLVKSSKHIFLQIRRVTLREMGEGEIGLENVRRI